MEGRFLAPMALSLLATGCIAVSSGEDDTITNEAGVTVSEETISLNGLWDGQQDQTGAWRLLIYQGIVYAKDDDQGYYGSIDYDQDNQTLAMDLKAYTYSASDTTSLQYLASGIATTYTLDGLVFTASTAFDTLVGDFETSVSNGSFLLTNDDTWDQTSNLGLLIGQWTAGTHSLYVTSLGATASIKGISSADGCTYQGTISMIDKSINLYDILISERKNCSDFNATDIVGYATLNASGELEFYLKEGSSLFFMTYTATTAG